MFERVLICTDLTDGVQRLLKFVPSLAAGGIQSVMFLHTVPLSDEQIPRQDSGKTQEVRDRLSALLGEVPSGVSVQFEVASGKPIDLILAAIKTHRADLVIMGMPSRSILNEKLFGSTTMGVCQRTPVPLLTFRPQLIAALTPEELDIRCRHLLSRVLVPYDGSAAGDYLISKVKQDIRNHNTGSLQYFSLCWVVEDVSRDAVLREQDRQTAQQKLNPIKADLEALGLEVKAVVRHGNPVVQVLTAAQEEGVGAIAIASDSLGSLREWSTPSFAGEILRRSWHPVLYFPVVKGS